MEPSVTCLVQGVYYATGWGFIRMLYTMIRDLRLGKTTYDLSAAQAS